MLPPNLSQSNPSTLLPTQDLPSNPNQISIQQSLIPAITTRNSLLNQRRAHLPNIHPRQANKPAQRASAYIYNETKPSQLINKSRLSDRGGDFPCALLAQLDDQILDLALWKVRGGNGRRKTRWSYAEHTVVTHDPGLIIRVTFSNCCGGVDELERLCGTFISELRTGLDEVSGVIEDDFSSLRYWECVGFGVR